MSLFPAYKTSCDKKNHEKKSEVCFPVDTTSTGRDTEVQDLSWLNNASYPSFNIDQNKDKSEVNEENSDNQRNDCAAVTSFTNKRHISKKKKKRHKTDKPTRSKKATSKQQAPAAVLIHEGDNFYEDKKQERTNFLVETLHRPAIPRYDKYNRYFKKLIFLKKKLKKGKLNRYFLASSSKIAENKEENYFDPNSKEEELTRTTESFNKTLADNVNDIDTWINYVSFQDTMYEFEKLYRKNPIGGERVTAERKLAILERAIKSNPASERLLALRLSLAEQLRPADQLAEECSQALLQDPGNMTLWRTLVRTTRNNTARCTAPGVLQMFAKAITRIGQLRLYRKPLDVEQNILALLLESGLFLQQAGLWEQLWTLLQMYLGISLTATGQFDILVAQEENKLREEEDRILASGLPLSVLWLRVEKLRAATHFVPDNNCDADPQRVVFSDDMAGLLQPVMSDELRLPLVVTSLVLLKVPLLPTRHSLLQCLGLLDISSSVNNVESLLATLSSTGISDSQGSYLSSALDLITEPQMVREQLGHQQFLSWVLSVMQRCADLLQPAESVLIHAWALRMYALLCRLHNRGFAGVPKSMAKLARNHAKQLLKQTQFRDNLMLYVEYAMVERSTGDLDKAIKVLETASAMPHSQQDVHYVLLCRRLVECLLAKNPITQKQPAVKVLTTLEEEVQWQQRTDMIVTEQTPLASHPLSVAEAMTPQLLVEWLSCHALFLYLTKTVWEATAFLQRYIELLPHSQNTLGCLWVEQLYEVTVDLLYFHTSHSKTSFKLLRTTLVQALKIFPNNLSLLHILATIETRSGGGGTPLWKLVSYFPPSAPLARLILVFVVHSRVSSQSSEELVGGRNYLRNLLRQLTAEQTTRECPLMWRLYLQLVAVVDSSTQVKHVFYKSLQNLPWVKAFYLDAAKFLPEELSEIQDLIIEKELRIHTTPEELEILRD